MLIIIHFIGQNFPRYLYSTAKNYILFIYIEQLTIVGKTLIIRLIQFSIMIGKITIFILIAVHTWSACIHDQFMQSARIRYLYDSSSRRLLADDTETSMKNLRVYMDYNALNSSLMTNNIVKRIMNITANYYYLTLKVDRMERLYFPFEQGETEATCHSFAVPREYESDGVIADMGIFVGSEIKPKQPYVAKSQHCVLLNSTQRPVWGAVIWNEPFLKSDQAGFQQTLFVGLHEMMHNLGFSAYLYEKFPKGNPYKRIDDIQYLSSPQIDAEVKKMYGCEKVEGMLLQDQDGSYISSHWERKVGGTEFMIPTNKKDSIVSRVSLALLDSTGWYEVNYTMAQTPTWGKGTGCQFLNRKNCDFDEFCSSSRIQCDHYGSGYGTCRVDPFAGTCKMIRYYSNTICYDDQFEIKNLNAKQSAQERGGFLSRCYQSDIRAVGIQPSKINARCYLTICSPTARYIYLLIGSRIVVCFQHGQVVNAPPGMEGELKCPDNFEDYCGGKKTCPYHCNINGLCLDGQCLCTKSLQFTKSCLDEAMTVVPVGNTGGLLKSIVDPISGNIIKSITQSDRLDGTSKTLTLKKYRYNSACMHTSYLDIFGYCNPCKPIFGCDYCNSEGCVVCDNGFVSVGGKCP